MVLPVDSDQRVELRFSREEAGAAELQGVIDEVIAELDDSSSESAKLAREAGLDPGELGDADVSVAEEAQGVEPVTMIIVAVAGSFGGEVAKTLWREVIWPRVKRRLGVAAVGPEEDS
jgi:hypothetical protein